jgi:hypothetical protein
VTSYVLSFRGCALYALLVIHIFIYNFLKCPALFKVAENYSSQLIHDKAGNDVQLVCYSIHKANSEHHLNFHNF